MVNETDFFNVLRNIATQLKNINENLEKLASSRKAETDQFVKESRARMRDGRILLSESRKNELEQNVEKMLRESKLNPKITVNTRK